MPNYFSIFSFIPWINFRISRSGSKETARGAFSRARSVDKSGPVDWNFTCIPVRIVSPKEWIHLSFFPERTAPLILTQSFWFFQARVNLNAPWWESTKVWIAIPVQLFAYFQSVTLQNKYIRHNNVKITIYAGITLLKWKKKAILNCTQ